MNKLNIKDWFVFGEWYNIYWFHSCYVNGLGKGLKKHLGYGLSQLVGEQSGNVQRIYFSRSEWTHIGKKYLKEILSHPAKLKYHLKKIKVSSDELVKYSKYLSKINFKEKSKNQIIDLLKQYHHKHYAVWDWGMIPNIIDLENPLFSEYLKKILISKKLNKKEVKQAFQSLTTPLKLSVAQKEELDILKLVKNGATKDDLIKHYKKYSWISFGWIGPELSYDYFFSRYKELRKKSDLSEYHEIINFQLDLKIQKEYWINKLNLSNKEKNFFSLMEELLYMKTYRMDATYLSYHAVQPLLKQIAKLSYMSLAQVYTYYIDWLIDILSNNSKINSKDLTKSSVRFIDGKDENLLFGKEAQEMLKAVKKEIPKPKKVSKLVGETAYPGKVTGKVSVINIASEMKKFKTGNILVSSVTDPSLLPIMKKAKAFVTDQGGLTCHAAIIARELKKPCVISTKIATRSLSDGDQVEVDASNGIVKKIR